MHSFQFKRPACVHWIRPQTVWLVHRNIAGILINVGSLDGSLVVNRCMNVKIQKSDKPNVRIRSPLQLLQEIFEAPQIATILKISLAAIVRG